MPAWIILCYANNTIKWKHSNIWHKSSTKHKRSDQIETIKTIMQTTRPRITWKVYQWLRLPFLRNIRSSAKRFRLWIIYSELKRHNVSHYIYYLATDNIHIVLENDNTVLIKGLKKVVNVKFSRNTHLINVYDRLKSREITFQQYRGKILLKQRFSIDLQISMNIKDITIPLIIHYYLLRAFRTLHKSFHAKS